MIQRSLDRGLRSAQLSPLCHENQTQTESRVSPTVTCDIFNSCLVVTRAELESSAQDMKLNVMLTCSLTISFL